MAYAINRLRLWVLCVYEVRSVFALTFVLHACNWLYTNILHTYIDAIVWCTSSMNFDSKFQFAAIEQSRTRFNLLPNSTIWQVITVCWVFCSFQPFTIVIIRRIGKISCEFCFSLTYAKIIKMYEQNSVFLIAKWTWK